MSIGEARAREASLRAALAAAVAERARATREADRLEGRAQLADADGRVAEAAAAQRTLAERAGAEADRLRAELRAAEGLVVSLEAESDTDRAGGNA